MRLLTVAVGGPLTCAALVNAARRATAAGHLQQRGGRLRWRLSNRLRPRVARALIDADIEREPEEALELWMIGVAAAIVVSLAVAPGMLLLVGMGALGIAPLGLWLARGRRDRRFGVELPAALEQVAAELRGGGTVSSAISRLAGGDSAVAPDLHRVEVRSHLGLSLADALAGWPLEHDVPGVRAAAGAFAVASSLGGSAAEAIDGLASSLRHRLDAAAEAKALSAQARLSAVVVGTAPIGYLVLTSIADPASVGVLTGTGAGRACVLAGLTLEGLAAVWIRHIVRSEA